MSVGSRLDGRYQLQEVLGDGGSATVFGGTDTVLDRPVAVKVFHSRVDSTTQARRRREINLAADFVHPHLVAVYDAHLGSDDRSGRTPGAPSYLVTEYVDGQTLARRLDGPPLTHSEVAQIGIGLARALAVLHRSGVVHRDVKPGNILLEARTGQVKLGDFGIARDLGEDPVTRTADVVGTAPYLSPEQARGDPVGCPSDVYSLGLVLLECLTGHREYAGTPVEAAVARLVRDPEVPPDLPTPWPTLLRRMTSRDAAHRPAADEVAAILAHHHHGTEPPAAASETSRGRRTVPTPEQGTATTHRPRAWLLAAAAGAAVALAAGLVTGMASDDPAADPAPATATPNSATPNSRQDLSEPPSPSTVEAPPPAVTVTAAEPPAAIAPPATAPAIDFPSVESAAIPTTEIAATPSLASPPQEVGGGQPPLPEPTLGPTPRGADRLVDSEASQQATQADERGDPSPMQQDLKDKPRNTGNGDDGDATPRGNGGQGNGNGGQGNGNRSDESTRAQPGG